MAQPPLWMHLVVAVGIVVNRDAMTSRTGHLTVAVVVAVVTATAQEVSLEAIVSR